MRSAADLIQELNSVDESTTIEAKKASQLGDSVMETVSAFANEPGLGGGYILLGVTWCINDVGDKEYSAEGVPDPDQVQADLATKCNGMLNQTIRPQMQVEELDGKPVIVVRVAEVDSTNKPIYLLKPGLPRGAFRRIGSTDQRCTDEDLWILRDADGPQQTYDASVIDDATIDDFSAEAIAEYRRLRGQAHAHADELTLKDATLLEAVGAVRRVAGQVKPTVAGILIFGTPAAIRRVFPAMRIDYVRIVGTDWQDDPDHTYDIRRPLLLAMRQAVAVVIDELPRGFDLPEGEIQSHQETVVPQQVIREAIANAVMHRSYRVNEPIQIVRYSNRIEITNPGYSLKNPADLGHPGSRQRNPYIAAVLHDVNLAETKGTGVGRMRRLIQEAGLTPPDFVSDRENNRFRAGLHLHHLLTQEDINWLRGLTTTQLSDDESKVLIYARETGAVDNTACREITGLDTLGASGLLRHLRDICLLTKQGGGSQTHYVLAPERPDNGLFETHATGDPGPQVTKLAPEVTKLGAEVTKLSDQAPELPPELAARAANARTHRLREGDLRALIRDLCAQRALGADELEAHLGKGRQYLLNQHLRPMIHAGELEHLYPESPKHPNQKYIAKITEAGGGRAS